MLLCKALPITSLAGIVCTSWEVWHYAHSMHELSGTLMTA